MYYHKMPAKSSTTSTSKSSSTPTKQKRAKKTTPKSKSTKESVAESVPVTVAAPVAVTVAAPVAAPVAESVPVPVAESSEETSASSSLENIETEFVNLASRLQELKTLQSAITSELKRLHKNVHRHMKENSKKHKKRKNLDPNRPKREPSGFAKPALISTELCSFLGKPEGTEMARTEVTKYLTQYIKEHKLQDDANRRKILPNEQLQQLLNVQQGDEVTYFNLQKYMKVHFPKSAGASA
jgi:upstream activation factor subunit UAF30